MGKRAQTIRNKRKIKVSNYQNEVLDTKDAHKVISKGLSRELKFTIISIFIVTIVIISSAFAIFSSVQKSENYNTLTVGTLKVDFNDTDSGMGNIISLNGAYPESDIEGQKETPYVFKITNSGTLNASYIIKVLDDTDMIAEDGCQDNLLDKAKIKISINGGTPVILSSTEASGYVVEASSLAASKSSNYELRVWIDEASGNEVLGKHYHGKIVIEAQNDKSGSLNVVDAFTYNDQSGTNNYCVTGEETTCQKTECYKDKTVGSCPAGTIINYNVNNTESHYFYVLHDDGNSMTLQQRENTTENVAWYKDSNDNTKGPLTILTRLEEVTSDWTNVNNQTYTMGTTNFNNTNMFTGCDAYNNCTANTYTLKSRTSKARMITVQEASSLGCDNNNKSCPIWMHNYLHESTSYDGTVDNPYIYGYLTMSAYITNPSYSWHVDRMGHLGAYVATTVSPCGARAVIVINK